MAVEVEHARGGLSAVLGNDIHAGAGPDGDVDDGHLVGYTRVVRRTDGVYASANYVPASFCMVCLPKR